MVQRTELALVLALELSPDLVADFGPCLVLEFALDTVRELARPLDRNPSSGAPQGACALPGKEEEMKRLMFVLALCLAVGDSVLRSGTRYHPFGQSCGQGFV